jgi:predicted metal-dependent peptidase
MLAAFFAELNALAAYATFTVIPFDTEVDESLVYEWKKGQRKTWERVKCGGTCFDAPTIYVNKQGFDGHIILTDMEAPKPKPSKCQRIWFTDENGKANPYFKTNERIIAIDVKGGH